MQFESIVQDPRYFPAAGVSVDPTILATPGVLESGLGAAGLGAAGLGAAGLGEFEPGDGLCVHFDPKSGHATPEKYTPRTVPKVTKMQHITRAIITPVFILNYFKVFLRL